MSGCEKFMDTHWDLVRVGDLSSRHDFYFQQIVQKNKPSHDFPSGLYICLMVFGGRKEMLLDVNAAA